MTKSAQRIQGTLCPCPSVWGVGGDRQFGNSSPLLTPAFHVNVTWSSRGIAQQNSLREGWCPSVLQSGQESFWGSAGPSLNLCSLHL